MVDYGNEQVTNTMVEAYMREHNYPLNEVLHQFLSLKGSFQDNLTTGEAIVNDWLPSQILIDDSRIQGAYCLAWR